MTPENTISKTRSPIENRLENNQWVAEGSPTHSTPVRIEDPLQFVPAGTTTKEFKRVQQQVSKQKNLLKDLRS